MIRRLLFLLVLALPALAWSQTRRFQNPVLLPTSGDPGAVSTGDWNHDGKADLIYIDGSANATLHVLLGNGDGTFTPGQSISLPPDSCHEYVGRNCYLTSADVNGDGKADLIYAAVGNQFKGIVTLPGNGDGTFGSPIASAIQFPVSSPYTTFRPAIGDFNSDGKADLVIADPINGGVYFLAGNGSGHFSYISTFSNTKYNSGRPGQVYAHDFNGDGKMDVLVLSSGGTTSAVVFYGNGTGGFTEGPSYTVGPINTYYYGTFTAYIDVTGDGIPDLVGDDSQSNVWVLPGRSDGSFGTALQLTGQLEPNDVILAAADINGDGLVDFIAQTPAGVRILPGTSGSALGTAQVVTTGTANLLVSVTADFNGDGIQDIASGTEGGIVLLFGSKASNFANSTLVDTGRPVSTAISGDFNGDGRDDALIQQVDGSFNVFFGQVSGGFSAGPSFTPANSLSYIGNAVGDFDGDGKLDVAFNHTGIQILFGNGDGTFNLGPVSQGMTWGLVADLNSDGKTDMVGVTGPFIDSAYNYIYSLTAMMGNASRTLTTVTTTLRPDYRGNDTPLIVAVGDLNHDGHVDVVLYDRNQQNVQLWIGNGDGTFRAGGTIDLSVLQLSLGTVTSTMRIGGIVDLDGDGKPDLVALGLEANANTTSQSACLVVFHGDGSGGLGLPQIIPLSHSYASLYLSDIDQDGKPDLVLTDGVLISVLPNLGNGNLGSEQHYVDGQAMVELSLGDFNGDHFPDLMATPARPISPYGGNLVSVLLSQPDSRQSVTGTILASPSTVAYNQGFTLTASLSPTGAGAPAPTGTVDFSIDGLDAGAAQVQNGTTTLTVLGATTQSIAYGLHQVTGLYSGDSHYPSAWMSGALTVLKPDYQTSTSLTATPASTLASNDVSLTAVVTAAAVVTKGVVTFYDGTSVIGQTNVSSSETASLDTNLLSVGSHSLTAVYQGFSPPSSNVGNAIFEPSKSPPVAVTITGVATSTTLTPSTQTPVLGTVLTVSASVTAAGVSSVPYGSVSFFDGTSLLGTVALDDHGSASFSTSSLAGGQHSLTAVYNQSGIFTSSASATAPIAVRTAATGLGSSYVLFTGTDKDSDGSGTVLTVAVRSERGQPTGSVTLIEDGQIVGTNSVTASGLTAFTVRNKDASVHTFYASYAGTREYAPSSSSAVASTDYQLADFSLRWSSARLGLFVSNGSTGFISSGTSAFLQVNAVGAWKGAVSLSCESRSYVCDFAPGTVTGSGVSLLTIRPIAATRPPSSSVSIVAITLLIAGFRSRRRLLIVLLAFSLGAVQGCGSGSNGDARGPRSDVLTIQAVSGGTVHSIQISVSSSL